MIEVWLKKKILYDAMYGMNEIGRAHVWTPVTDQSRMPSSAWKKKKKTEKKIKEHDHNTKTNQHTHILTVS